MQKGGSELNSSWKVHGNNEVVEYFTLEDLWKCYDEWSAFGAGTRVELESGDSITQYYVPYLSAIQIYSSKSSVSPRFSTSLLFIIALVNVSFPLVVSSCLMKYCVILRWVVFDSHTILQYSSFRGKD